MMERIHHGHIVLKRDNDLILVLVETNEYTPFVVWRIDPQGNTFAGDYHTSLDDALAGFNARSYMSPKAVQRRRATFND